VDLDEAGARPIRNSAPRGRPAYKAYAARRQDQAAESYNRALNPSSEKTRRREAAWPASAGKAG